MKRVLFFLFLFASRVLGDAYDDEVKLKHLIEDANQERQARLDEAETRYQKEQWSKNNHDSSLIPSFLLFGVILLFIFKDRIGGRPDYTDHSKALAKYMRENPNFNINAPAINQAAELEPKAKFPLSSKEKTFYLVTGTIAFLLVMLRLIVRH